MGAAGFAGIHGRPPILAELWARKCGPARTPTVTADAHVLWIRSRDGCYPARGPDLPVHTAWLPQPCSSSDMAVPSMQFGSGAGGAAGTEAVRAPRTRPLCGQQAERQRVP